MTTLEELQQAYNDASWKHIALVSAKSDEENALIAAVRKEMSDKHDAGIGAAAKVLMEARKALQAEEDRITLEEAKGRAPYPVGTKVYEWELQGDWNNNRHGYSREAHLTGRVGRVELVTRDVVILDTMTWSRPSVGTYIIRLLKKDGTPSKRFERRPDWTRWLPEGVEPGKE
jgi:hypothetical protein